MTQLTICVILRGMSEHVVPWQETFAVGLEFIRAVEGGVSDRLPKQDLGGLTNFGITQTTLSEYRRTFPEDPDTPISVRLLTWAQAQRIYLKLYWQPCRCEEFPPSIALVVFNAAVQSGVRRAIEWLQMALNVNTDGFVGPITIAAAHSQDISTTVDSTLTNQLLFESEISNWNSNRRGWTRRLFKICWLAAIKASSRPDMVEEA